MAAVTTIVIKHDSATTAAEVAERLARPASDKKNGLRMLIRLLEALVAGTRLGRVSVKVDDVTVGDRASVTNTITQASLVADTDTLTIGDITLSWKAAASTESEVTIGGTATICATNLVAKINAHSQLKGLVSATSAAGVVTISCAFPGRIGEMITLAEVGNGQVLSATRLTGVTATCSAAFVDYDAGVA